MGRELSGVRVFSLFIRFAGCSFILSILFLRSFAALAVPENDAVFVLVDVASSRAPAPLNRLGNDLTLEASRFIPGVTTNFDQLTFAGRKTFHQSFRRVRKIHFAQQLPRAHEAARVDPILR